MSESSPADVTLDSSTSDPVVETASTPVIEGVPASALDAVEQALKTEGVEAGSPPAANRSEDTKAKDPNVGDGVKDDDGTLSDEEKKLWSPNAQERLRNLAAQKNELRGQVEKLTADFEPVKAKAERHDKLQTYLTENNIDAKEANNALEITRLIKSHDYQRAYEIVAPIFQELHKRVGGVLDTDLAEEVRLGRIEKQRAQEIQRGRAREATDKVREQSRTEAETRQAEEAKTQANRQLVSDMAKAGDEWAKAKADTDPDWNQKAELVASELAVIIMRDGYPRSKDEANKLSEKALAVVEERLAPMRPKTKAINPARPAGSASPRDLPPPTTALEALERGLAQTP